MTTANKRRLPPIQTTAKRHCPQTKVLIDANDSKARLTESFLTKYEADSLLDDLLQCDSMWDTENLKCHTNKSKPRRKVSAFSDPGVSYTYSRRSETGRPWGRLASLKKSIEETLGIKVNFCHANLYQTGAVGLAWHSDDEDCIEQNSTIVSVSLGAGRDFAMRLKSDHKQKKVVHLTHGSLLTMEGKFQSYYQHTVPLRKRVSGTRVNLTFRKINQ